MPGSTWSVVQVKCSNDLTNVMTTDEMMSTEHAAGGVRVAVRRKEGPVNRLPVAERREQLVEAALTVATRDGIEAATVRAVAAEAGVSLGVVHYCFQDKDELLRAMAHTITERNMVRGVAEMPDSNDVGVLMRRVVETLWHNIRSTRGPQLLTYELTTVSLRHPELKQVGAEQYRLSWGAADLFLSEIEQAAGIVWTAPRERLARSIIAAIDGFSLAWLVDDDEEAALDGLHLFAQFLASQTAPAGSADPGESGTPAAEPAAGHHLVAVPDADDEAGDRPALV